MQFFKFPPELRDEILFCACLARGLTRALRLKLVCKTFRHAVDLALFRTRFLDEPVYLDGWCFRENFGFAELFQAYISFRIRSPPLPDDGRIADLRSVCRWLAAETQTDVSLVIDALSKAAIGPIGMASMSDNERRKGTKYNDNETVYEENMQQARFSSAVYLGHPHLATKFMHGGAA